VVNVFPLEADLQRLTIEAPPLAHRTGHPDVRQKIHLQSSGAVTFARLAAASRFVEAEAAGRITADLGFRHLRKQRANFIKQLDVSRRVRSWRTANRRLIDIDDLVDVRYV